MGPHKVLLKMTSSFSDSANQIARFWHKHLNAHLECSILAVVGPIKSLEMAAKFQQIFEMAEKIISLGKRLRNLLRSPSIKI